VDSLFREGQILFESPKGRRNTDGGGWNVLRMSVPEESKFWHFFRKKMHSPIYRIWVHALSEVFFISMVYLSLSKPRRQNLEIQDANLQSEQIWTDLVVCLLLLHYLINDVVEIVRRTRVFFSSFWNVYTLVANIVLLSGGLITFGFHQYYDMDPESTNNRAELPGSDPLSIGVTLIALGAILYGLRTARWFLLHNRAGPIIICIIRVLKDVIYVFFIWIIVFMSFALGIWLVYKPYHAFGKCTTEYCLEEKLVHDNETMQGVLSQMFWLVFNGDGSSQRIQHRTAVDNTMEFSKEFSHPMGLSLWAMYQGIICILLINILIAMMNTTYENVWKNVDGEWKFSKSHFEVAVQFHISALTMF